MHMFMNEMQFCGSQTPRVLHEGDQKSTGLTGHGELKLGGAP